DRIEVAFSVAPSVRRIRFHDPDSLDLRADGLRAYFSSSLAPDSQPHGAILEYLHAADRAPPGQALELPLSLPAGRHVVLAPARHGAVDVLAKEGGGFSEVSLGLLAGRPTPDPVTMPAGKVPLRLLNRTHKPVGFLVMPMAGAKWPSLPAAGEPLPHPSLPYL